LPLLRVLLTLPMMGAPFTTALAQMLTTFRQGWMDGPSAANPLHLLHPAIGATTP